MTVLSLGMQRPQRRCRNPEQGLSDTPGCVKLPPRSRQPLCDYHQPTDVKHSSNSSFRNLGNALLGFLLVSGLAHTSFGQNPQPAAKSSRSSQNLTAPGENARGEYIVNNVAVCGQCHTPRNAKGEPDRTKWLEGAPLWLTSAQPVENWPLSAPRIAGALPGTDAEMLTLLTTGIWKTGTYLRPPMPQFRISREDAEAVISYLKSEAPAPK